MRKMLILTVIILIACTGIALASWGVATLIRGDNEAKAPGALASAEVKGLSSAGPTAAQTAQVIDATGKVTDRTTAIATTKSLAQVLKDTRTAMNGTWKALREAVQAFRQAHPRPATTPSSTPSTPPSS